MRARHTAIVVLVAAVAVSADGGAPPEPLNELARALVHRRMVRHGEDLRGLLEAVIRLERRTAQDMVRRIEAEPRITRPIAGGEADLNATVPERFFVLQDELSRAVSLLSQAISTGDDALLAARFGELTRTCVACHSAYLSPTARKIDGAGRQ